MPRPAAHRPRHLAEEAAPTWWAALDRRRLAVAMGTSLFALPLVVLDNLPSGTQRAEAVEVVSPTTTTAPPALAPTTTVTVEVTTTLPPTTAAPATTAAPETTTTTARPRPTTTAPPATAPPTTAPPPPPPTAPAAPVAEEYGQATWYHWNPGECAHKTLPRGTVVTVVNLASGASTTCVVTDRGPYGAGRIIDLDESVFAQIAPLSAGVIDVRITW